MSSNDDFTVAEISLKNRKRTDVIIDHLWGLWYFLFPFYVLTKTENTILYVFILGLLFLVCIGFSHYVFPLVVQIVTLLAGMGVHFSQELI